MPPGGDQPKLLRSDPDADIWNAIRQLSAEVAAVRELAGREVRASEIFRRLIVGIGDVTEHDHDTLVLLNDEERALFRSSLRRTLADDKTAVATAQRLAWHQTLWGRAGVAVAAAVAGLDFWRAATGH